MTVDKEPWHVQKNIPLALIFAIVMQGVGVVWYLGGVVGRIERAEIITAENRAAIQTLSARQSATDTAAARIDERLKGLQSQLDRIERAVTGRDTPAN